MAINTEAKQQSSGKRVGINTFKVISINPDTDTAIRLNLIKEDRGISPYVAEDKSFVRLDFYMQRVDTFPIKLTFFINNKEKVTKAGDKFIWVDSFGNSTIWMNEETMRNTDFTRTSSKGKDYKVFDTDSARKSYGEEAELYSFIKGWLNIGLGTECSLDLSKFYNSDFSEIQDLMNAQNAKNEVVLALGVQGDEQYHQFYKKSLSYCGLFGNKEKKFTLIADKIQKDTYTLEVDKMNFGTYPYNWGEVQDEELVSEEKVESNTGLPF